MNPEIFIYEPRGMRVFNWYLYTYLICSVAMFVAAWWLSHRPTIASPASAAARVDAAAGRQA